MNYPWKMLKCSWRREVKHIFHTFLLGMFVLRLEKHCMQLLKLYLKIQNEKCRKVLGKRRNLLKRKIIGPSWIKAKFMRWNTVASTHDVYKTFKARLVRGLTLISVFCIFSITWQSIQFDNTKHNSVSKSYYVMLVIKKKLPTFKLTLYSLSNYFQWKHHLKYNVLRILANFSYTNFSQVRHSISSF